MKLQILRAVFAAALLALPASGSTATAATLSSTGAPTTLNSDSSPQVYLRRLHLVRPDLIPYPIAVEIFC
jgi:hypothetical protein